MSPDDSTNSYYDSTDRFTDILEWRGFLVCTRISYGLYLTQFPMFFYNVGRVRTPIHYESLKNIVSPFSHELSVVYDSNCLSFQVDTSEFLCIGVLTVALTLLIEMPFNNLKSWLLEGSRKVQTEQLNVDVNANIKEKIL